jgi:predicted lysophospholipase L1 biosynthesis ABC-type transport system permease subunit
MNQTNHAHEDLRVIKKMMEQSTKFLSLSGLSGVAAGMVALLGAAAAWWKLDQQPSSAKLP